MLPWSDRSAARISAGAPAAPRRKEEWLSVGAPISLTLVVEPVECARFTRTP
jgi:hypothetical protein